MAELVEQPNTLWDFLIKIGLFFAAAFQVLCICAIFVSPRASDSVEKDLSVSLEEIAEEVERELPFKVYAAASFALVMIVIGIPVWWKTTEVYRAAIPYAHISFLSDLPVEIPISIGFTYFDEKTNETARRCASSLSRTLRGRSFHEKLKFPARLFLAEARNSQKTFVNTAKSFRELDDIMTKNGISESSNSEPTFNIFVLPSDFASEENETTCFLGQGSAVYVRNSDNIPSVVEIIEDLVLEVYLNTDRLTEIINISLKERRSSERHGKSRNFQKKVWTGSLHPSHALDFYLINPNPEKCDTVELSFGTAVEEIMKLFQLEIVTSLNVRSQRLYYVNLPTMPSFNVDDKFYYFEHFQLPHLINPLERFVTSLEPEKPVFHMVVMITPPEYHPLHILEDAGSPSNYNGFAVASWGGLTIYNPPSSCNKSLTLFSVEVKKAIISQLRILFGISSNSLPQGFQRYGVPIAQWEVQKLIIQAILDNFLTAGTTLQSLTRLLDTIQNIVISDEIGERIKKSVEGLQKAVVALNGRDSLDGLKHSKTAFLEAEKAFFDPSLLALLYFPDDQKYAIYIPLFLPVGLPVLLSLISILKYYKRKWKGDLKKKKE